MPDVRAKAILSPFMDTLLNKRATEAEKTEAYLALTQQLRNNDATESFTFVKSKCPSFLNTVLTDAAVEKADLSHAALQTLGVCLNDRLFTRDFTNAVAEKVVTSLFNIIKSSKDKTTCTRALWCMSKQDMPAHLLKPHISEIVAVLEHAMCHGNVRSPIVEHESVNTVIRLFEQCSDGMERETVKWAKLMYPMLIHNAGRVRERALLAMDLGLPLILQNQEYQDAISDSLVQDLKLLLLSEMKKLMKEHDGHVMRVWSIYVQILGKRLHHGGFINQMLPLVEEGFKSSKPEVRVNAYQAWKALIDCFALDKAILEDARRLKLVMQVFRLTSPKCERVALEKLNVWWHYIVTLKPSNPVLFDQVVIPLFNYCLGMKKGGTATAGKGASPSTPSTPLRRNASGGFASPPTPSLSANNSAPGSQVYRSVQLKAMEMIALLLNTDSQGGNFPKAKFTVDKPDEALVGLQIFSKQGVTIIHTVRELLLTVGNEVQDGVLYHVWNSLMVHLKNILEHGNRKESIETVTCALNCIQELVTAQAMGSSQMLRLIECMTDLPRKVLSSSSYNIGTTSGTAVIQGCPASTLFDLIFEKKLLEESKQERFFIIMERLIGHGVTNPVGALVFLQSCLKHIDTVTKNTAVDLLWRMWSIIVNPLLELMMKTNEVNQGDSLEHNFTCLYLALEFPLIRLISSDLLQVSMKSMLKTWSELYTTFSRLAAMVPNAEANVCCEELCERILTSGVENILETTTGVEYLSAVCKVMVDTLDFSSLTQPNILSPVKFGKRKQKELGNLSSIVKLVSLVIVELHNIIGSDSVSAEGKKRTEASPNMVGPANDLIHVLCQLFNHLPTSSMITATLNSLATPVAQFFSGAAKRTSKLYTQQFAQKLEKLWMDISTCLQGRYKDVYDSDILAVLSPLFVHTFLHPRRPIKNQAIILWNATFAQSQQLNYPEELKSVLAKVKEKTPIILPGWNNSNIGVIEDTPVSQMSQAGESTAPVPNIIGMPSPHKAHGSFINRSVSPSVKKSPLLAKKSPGTQVSASPGPARKRIPMANLDDLSSSDFVVIKNSPKKKMVLTEHQVEKMKEQRGTVPALYSTIDNSVDISLMDQFNNSESQESSTPTPVSFAPFKFPTSGSKESIKTDEREKRKKVELPKNKPTTRAKTRQSQSSVEDTDFESCSRPRRRSSRKSVRFSTDSQEDTKNDEEISTNLVDGHPIKMATESSVVYDQEYDAFGFMTPSGDSAVSNDAGTRQETKVNCEGDHKSTAKKKKVPTATLR